MSQYQEHIIRVKQPNPAVYKHGQHCCDITCLLKDPLCCVCFRTDFPLHYVLINIQDIITAFSQMYTGLCSV